MITLEGDAETFAGEEEEGRGEEVELDCCEAKDLGGCVTEEKLVECEGQETGEELEEDQV